LCKSSEFVAEMLGELAKDKFIERKMAAADRCPRELGTTVKTGEVRFHHEVTNQHIWNNF
jgi:glutamine synthetase